MKNCLLVLLGLPNNHTHIHTHYKKDSHQNSVVGTTVAFSGKETPKAQGVWVKLLKAIDQPRRVLIICGCIDSESF